MNNKQIVVDRFMENLGDYKFNAYLAETSKGRVYFGSNNSDVIKAQKNTLFDGMAKGDYKLHHLTPVNSTALQLISQKGKDVFKSVITMEVDKDNKSLVIGTNTKFTLGLFNSAMDTYQDQLVAHRNYKPSSNFVHLNSEIMDICAVTTKRGEVSNIFTDVIEYAEDFDQVRENVTNLIAKSAEYNVVATKIGRPRKIQSAPVLDDTCMLEIDN